MCDTYDTYALNGTCLHGKPKQLLFCDSQAEPYAQWQIYTFNGPLKKLVYHYTANARFDCVTSPVFPVSKGWANVTAADGQVPTVGDADDKATVTC
eukprot:g1815.t1